MRSPLSAEGVARWARHYLAKAREAKLSAQEAAARMQDSLATLAMGRGVFPAEVDIEKNLDKAAICFQIYGNPGRSIDVAV